ncbi:hypothetical protein [Pseudonocardia sp. EC080610-09]|nr:hypothetical protein [Pseudonocardia sp. EC080610-09]
MGWEPDRRTLTELGWRRLSPEADVAAELDHSRSVPVLRDGIYTG